MKQLQNKVTAVKQDLSNDQLKLKRVKDLIAVYEKVVEGNYIDNLIKTQREQEQTRAVEKRT